MKKIVITKSRFENMPKGSAIEVDRELDDNYIGWWSSSLGTFKVRVPKSKCEEIINEEIEIKQKTKR